jgi:hypothetical protein
MYRKLSIYLYLAGVLMLRPRALIFGGGDAARGLALARLATATTRRRFIRF